MMKNEQRRKSNRLKNFDYAKSGGYFVTICVQSMKGLLGEIKDGKMLLNNMGKIVHSFCAKTESHYGNIHISPFTIMPNHIHMIITIRSTQAEYADEPIGNSAPKRFPCPTAGNPKPMKPPHTPAENIVPMQPPATPTGNFIPAQPPQTPDGNIVGAGSPRPTLGNIVGYFKYGTTKQINRQYKTPGKKLWQRNYFDHVIRNQNDYNRIYEYIENNPLSWELDSLHPDNPDAFWLKP